MEKLISHPHCRQQAGQAGQNNAGGVSPVEGSAGVSKARGRGASTGGMSATAAQNSAGPTGPSSLSAMQAEEADLLQDTKYKNYVSQVDKVLKCFETTSEWQDLISSLSKLAKV